MKRSIRVAGIVTLATFTICYVGIRHELLLAKQAPSAPVRLAEQRLPSVPVPSAGSP